jgi:hypothetical protein
VATVVVTTVATEVVTEVVTTPVVVVVEPEVPEVPTAVSEPEAEAVSEEPAATADSSEPVDAKLHTREELEALKLTELRDLVSTQGGKWAGKNKAALVDDIIAAQVGV